MSPANNAYTGKYADLSVTLVLLLSSPRTEELRFPFQLTLNTSCQMIISLWKEEQPT